MDPTPESSPKAAPTPETAAAQLPAELQPAGAEAGAHGHGEKVPHGRDLYVLALSALGIVYGDIGTSPLYSLKECFAGAHPVPVTEDNVLGILSLVIWALILTVTVKYLVFVMRADNRGEGGIMALMALVQSKENRSALRKFILVTLGIFGAALLYGDGVITPAISVLSAIEGLTIVTPAIEPYIRLMTIIILTALFVFQRQGTAGVGAIFGPVMMLWFVVIGVLGLAGISHNPSVLWAVLPSHALHFFQRNGEHGFLALGAVCLAITGGEALYADMGHFGRKPIRLAWYAVVLPGLLLNYMGQGAMILKDPAAAQNPFFLLAPSWALVPLVVLSTAATVIASQAIISGAFSLTRQAVQLGYCPRIEIVHTSAEQIGQIYIPTVNWALFIGVVGLVMGFRTSTALAAAYGIAVTLTMVITTVLMFFVERDLWGWRLPVVLGITTFFLVVDLSFFLANFVKVADGGWFPLAVGAGVFTLLTTWKRGREILAERQREASLPMDIFMESFKHSAPLRVPGTAVFMTGNPQGVPTALLHNLKHNKVLHERVALLTIHNLEVPTVAADQRVEVEPLSNGLVRVVARYGFTETPSIPEIQAQSKVKGFEFEMMKTTFFLGRETLIPSKTRRKGMALWREALFAWMSRNARSATSFFQIPPNRVVELGAQIEL